MLPRLQRVERSWFTKTFKSGRVFNSPNLALRVLKKDGLQKFSFVVPKTTAPGATKRNLLRRRGYSAVKKIKNKIEGEGIFVFSLKKGAAGMSFQGLEKEIIDILAKAGLIKT